MSEYVPDIQLLSVVVNSRDDPDFISLHIEDRELADDVRAIEGLPDLGEISPSRFFRQVMPRLERVLCT